MRNNVSLRVWGKDHHGLAEEWLENRSQARKDVSSLELVRIARSAKNASWAAAIAAIIAALIAIASAVIAYVALQAISRWFCPFWLRRHFATGRQA